MRCRGPCPASLHRPASRLTFLCRAPPARVRNPREARVSPFLSRPGVGPRAVPVSNGESISTASARARARPATHLFPAFFVSTGCPQNMTGYPHSSVVFHRLLHRSSTGYLALPGGTLGCLRLAESYFHRLFPYAISRVHGGPHRLSGQIRLPFPVDPAPRIRRGCHSHAVPATWLGHPRLLICYGRCQSD